MLARVANNLFWMGRYIERAEHVARYLQVNYFSSLDASHNFSHSKQFVLNSLQFMVGDPNKEKKVLDVEEVLYNIGLDEEKPYSLLQCIKQARLNASSARDLISTELYETINNLYHFVVNYSSDHFIKSGLYDFTSTLIDFTTIIKAKINSTLIYDEVYTMISLGIELDNATQVIRIINAKYNDIVFLNNYEQTGAINPSKEEWSTLLKCLKSYDMMNRYLKRNPRNIDILDFLILNPICPNSVINSLDKISKLFKTLSIEEHNDRSSINFHIDKVYNKYKYMSVDRIEKGFQEFIDTIFNELVFISKQLETKYFNY